MTGFCIDGQFNDSYAFRESPVLAENQQIHQEIIPDRSGASRAGVRRCGVCGELISKWDESLAGLILKKRRFDISITYDGIVLVSPNFKTICEANNITGLHFTPLPNDPEFFNIQATSVVEYDSERRGTRFVKQCSVCGHFESVSGATPVYLKKGSAIPELGFVRTDLEFGSDDEKHPLLLCGRAAGKFLRDAKLKGIDFIKI